MPKTSESEKYQRREAKRIAAGGPPRRRTAGDAIRAKRPAPKPERECSACGETFIADDFCASCGKCEACCDCEEEYPAREQAIDSLQYYFRTVYEAAGLKWTNDNDAEITGLVEDIIDAAKSEIHEELESQEHKR